MSALLGALIRWVRASGVRIGASWRFFWNASATKGKELVMQPEGFKPAWIVIHHSLTEDGAVKDWDAIRRYHIETNGWKAIGYHIGLEEVDGKLVVQQGRPVGSIGAHCKGFNARSVGICLVGNYDREAPSDDRLFLLASVCRELQRLYGIHADQVIGHRESYALIGKPVEKSCPGKLFDLDSFRARLLEVKAA
jgi:N-acetylmuramoyl-L-alanine amidase